MNRSVVSVTLLLLVLGAVAPIQSTTYTVSPGSDLSNLLASSVDGDIFQLESGVYLVSEVQLTSGSRSIIGAGSGVTFINPATSYDRFVSLGGGTLSVQQLTLSNFARNPGPLPSPSLLGAIFHVEGGSLELANCIGTNNNAATQDGAIIGTTGSVTKTITLVDSTFTSNTATYGSVVALDGSNEGATLTVKGCRFDSNQNTQHGVLYVAGTSSSTLIIDQSTFTNNVGADRGSVTPESGSATITGSTFTNNVGDSGGAVAVYGPTPVNITNCTFTGNFARAGGGAIRWQIDGDQPLIVRDSVFLGNSGSLQGGVFELDTGNCLFENCLFKENIAPLGAAFIFTLNFTEYTIRNCTFADNVGSTAGGAIWTASTISVSSCRFTGNTAGQGSAIYAVSNVVLISDSSFEQNSGRSGAIFANVDSHVELSGQVLFKDNAASSDGGAVAVSGGTLVVADDAIVVMLGNTATQGGGLSLSSSALLHTKSLLNITGNTAKYGGGIYIDETSYELCQDTSSSSLIIAGNDATIAGGGVYYDSNNVSMDCRHISGTFTDNTAPYGNDEGSAPASILWSSSVPSLLRVGQHFQQTGVLRDIFDLPITSASNLISFVMSLTDSPTTPAGQLGFVSLIGLTSTAPRDLDGTVRFTAAIASYTGVRLPLDLTLSIASRPYSLPTQTFPIQLSACDGGYVTLRLNGQQFCLELLSASSWARAAAGAASGVAMVFVLGLWFLLVFKSSAMVHFGRVAAPSCLHTVCFGLLVVLISIFPWMSDTDSNCMARPWLAVIGLTVMLSGLFVVSFADVLRAHYRKPNDALLLAVVLTISLTANIIVLIVWTAVSPYELFQVIDETNNTLKQYCRSSDSVYIWVLVGLYAGFGCLFLLVLLVQSNYTFRYRQSKHFAFFCMQVAVVSAALTPVAANYLDDLDIFFLVVTLGLVGVALLPVVPLLGLRAYRVFYPMTGQRLEDRVDWLRNDFTLRKAEIVQIETGKSPFDASSLRSSPAV